MALKRNTPEPAGWIPRPKLWDWRSYLRADERVVVSATEARSARAKAELAAATQSLNIIRNRAIQRAKHAARRSALAEETGR